MAMTAPSSSARARDPEAGGQGRLADHERVVAGGGEILRDAGVQPGVVVPHRRSLAVSDATRSHDVSAEGVGQALVSETDAKDGDSPRQPQYDVRTDPGAGGVARTRRDHHTSRMHRLRFFGCDPVVPYDADVLSQHPEALRQVVGEGVVVIDEQEQWGDRHSVTSLFCLLYTSDAADDLTRVDLGG